MSAARCSTHDDGLHERSGLDGTDELQGDQQCITAILPDAETAAPRRPARRSETRIPALTEAGSGLQTVFALSCPIRLRRLVWILDRPERQGGKVIPASGQSCDTSSVASPVHTYIYNILNFASGTYKLLNLEQHKTCVGRARGSARVRCACTCGRHAMPTGLFNQLQYRTTQRST